MTESGDKDNRTVYEILAEDRFSGQEITEKDRQLLELEVALNQRIDEYLLKNPRRIPKAVYFIVPNEFGERFCFYGIKPLLTLFFPRWSGISKEYSKVLVHTFSMLSYFTPLIGGAISDSYLAKYHTIVYLSILYFLGCVLLAVFSINGLLGTAPNIPVAALFAPLVMIAMGTGGIKPCVSTHGGDQYLPNQRQGIDWFFTVFYTSINAGATISMNVSPILKDNVQCFGDSCYFGSFMMCALVFGAVTILFIFGRRYYRIVPAVGEFLPWKALKVPFIAGWRYFKATREERARRRNWLSFSDEVVGAPFVEETRQLGIMLSAIIPMIFFWMIYNQLSTEWQIQYVMMENAVGSVRISSENFQVINSVLIIILVPTLGLLYPWIERRGFRCTPLRRMGAGYILVITSFIISGVLQMAVDDRYNPTLNAKGDVIACDGCLHIFYQLPQWFLISLAEAFTSPTGLLFCYEEVGRALKAQSTSFWLFFISLGDLVVAAVEASLLQNPVVKGPSKYFMYSGVGAASFVWYLIQGYFYKYKADRELIAKREQTDNNYESEQEKPEVLKMEANP
ncbi:uncharacterized protein VTP21DRAFT_6412 [Calcarisporiella thermophila]|uniref:uncharacterized protein n=1 Tax=Calcarisporiella thermophila TaxID=911321 RepID=UPI0037434384